MGLLAALAYRSGGRGQRDRIPVHLGLAFPQDAFRAVLAAAAAGGHLELFFQALHAGSAVFAGFADLAVSDFVTHADKHK